MLPWLGSACILTGASPFFRYYFAGGIREMQIEHIRQIDPEVARAIDLVAT